jgi:uncharacterized protein (DUF4415 family)
MSASDTKKSSETDWERVDALTDETIDTSDIPVLSDAFFARATLRVPQQFTTVTVQVDSDVWDWFKAQGQECERQLNAALRIYVEAHKAYSSG